MKKIAQTFQTLKFIVTNYKSVELTDKVLVAIWEHKPRIDFEPYF